MIRTKKAQLNCDGLDPILEDCRAMLQRFRFSEDYISQFTDRVRDILNDYSELLGKESELEYKLVRNAFRVELKLYIPGADIDPFTNGENARKRFFGNLPTLNLNTDSISVSKRYAYGCNVVSVSIPLRLRSRKLLKDPMILAVLLGVLTGIVCLQLPQPVNSFIVDKIASPIMSLILQLLAGIMGPVIFISMVTSILTFSSINDLTNLGVKVFLRFLKATLFIIAVSVLISGIFFRSFGEETVNIVPDQLIDMVLDLVPTNIVRPFLENVTPQLVILGLLIGTTLLMLGDRVQTLDKVLVQLNDCMMNVMRIVLTVLPAIPFLSIMTNIAKGNILELLDGWKFIAACYAVFTAAIAVKAVKTSKTTKSSISDCWRKIKPAVKLAFTTGSTSAPMKMGYEISERDFKIKPEFSSFWIPMCSALFSPKTTINLVIATFMMAQLTGLQISIPFLLVLILVTLELSLASPGTASAWVTMFETFGMSTSYVGLFSAYRLLTNNYSAAVTEAYCMLEQYEAACKLDGLKPPEPGPLEERAA